MIDKDIKDFEDSIGTNKELKMSINLWEKFKLVFEGFNEASFCWLVIGDIFQDSKISKEVFIREYLKRKLSSHKLAKVKK